MSLTTKLISYWKLDEASGNALDTHGTNDLTDQNTVTSATGKIGNARDFELDTSEHFSLSDNASISTGDVSFTYTAWVQFETVQAESNSYITSKFSSTVGQKEFLFGYDGITDDRLFFGIYNSSDTLFDVDATTFGAISTATWYFVAAGFDNVRNEVWISVNAGAQDTASTSGNNPPDGTGTFMMGAVDNGGASFFHDGLIDEVGFWKRRLGQGEIERLYNNGDGLAYPFGGSKLHFFF